MLRIVFPPSQVPAVWCEDIVMQLTLALVPPVSPHRCSSSFNFLTLPELMSCFCIRMQVAFDSHDSYPELYSVPVGFCLDISPFFRQLNLRLRPSLHAPRCRW